MRHLIAAIALAACGGSSGPPEADVPCTPGPGTDLELYPVASGLTRPVFATAPPGDGRLFIIEQPGRIRVMAAGVLLEAPFLAIESLVQDSGGEQGLLGLAFHPGYADNGRLFVYYTRASDDFNVVAEYRVSAEDPNLADPTETLVLEMADQFSNHNGGMLAFGPRDGLLYIGTGDGGSGGDPLDSGQSLNTLLGKILRIDVDGGDPYGIPAGNPFADSPGGPDDPRPEIWAYGLRNPWRFSFDRQTGDLYIGDVGQGAVEEIDVQPAASAGGENYGWNVMEGSECFNAGSCDESGKVLPIAEYSHDGGRCSVTGGYVYRGTCNPDVTGWYFYADYCTNEVWTLQWPDATTPVDITADLSATDALFGTSSFGESASGEIYVTSLSNGTVYKIVRAGSVTVPDAGP